MLDGLTLNKVFIILVIALFILGPEKLPYYAQKLGEFVRSLKRMADDAKGRLKEEMGPEFDDVDWKQLDPRQYDPRRIIRDALLEDQREAQSAAANAAGAAGLGAAGAAAAGAALAGAAAAPTAVAEQPAVMHYDDEAT